MRERESGPQLYKYINKILGLLRFYLKILVKMAFRLIP